mmetsp:Transcript_135568/g.433697  ORF Transcript_135568/g.433697 Transcript_135568/m.433697 type:complete len:327 (+) Transcript_135568:273-1253(+)
MRPGKNPDDGSASGGRIFARAPVGFTDDAQLPPRSGAGPPAPCSCGVPPPAARPATPGGARRRAGGITPGSSAVLARSGEAAPIGGRSPTEGSRMGAERYIWTSGSSLATPRAPGGPNGGLSGPFDEKRGAAMASVMGWCACALGVSRVHSSCTSNSVAAVSSNPPVFLLRRFLPLRFLRRCCSSSSVMMAAAAASPSPLSAAGSSALCTRPWRLLRSCSGSCQAQTPQPPQTMARSWAPDQKTEQRPMSVGARMAPEDADAETPSFSREDLPRKSCDEHISTASQRISSRSSTQQSEIEFPEASTPPQTNIEEPELLLPPRRHAP